MRRNDPSDPESWFDYAEEDLRRSERRFREPDLQDCLVHLQQCAQKAMKGKLIALGWPLEKTHNLVQLADELALRGIDLDWFGKTAGLLLAGYIGDRYPASVVDEIDESSVQIALAETKQLFGLLTGRTPS
jgi:HEPN domain-containing protein